MEKEFVKLYQDKDWLYERFVNQGKSLRDIGKEAKVSKHLIDVWLKNHELVQYRPNYSNELV